LLPQLRAGLNPDYKLSSLQPQNPDGTVWFDFVRGDDARRVGEAA